MKIGTKGLFFPRDGESSGGDAIGQLAFVTGAGGGEGASGQLVLVVFPNSGAMGIKVVADDPGTMPDWADGTFEADESGGVDGEGGTPAVTADAFAELSARVSEMRDSWLAQGDEINTLKSRLDAIGTGNAPG